MHNIDLGGLRELYRANSIAKVVLDHFGSRARNAKYITIERLQENLANAGYVVDRTDLIYVFRELESCGCGQFKVGRRGHKSRFEWAVRMIDVGRAAAGETDEVADVTEVDLDDNFAADGGELLRHSYRLRPDLIITLELPVDLSQSEASRLAEFVKTLPFDT